MANVLVVDDEPNNIRILQMDLEDAGHHVFTAVDGLDGWAKLEQHPDTIEVILLDRMMPRMNGMEFMHKIKQHPEFARIPVIMQTAAAENEQVIEGIKAGVYYYLTKPYEEEVLLSIVNAALVDYGNQNRLRESLAKHQKCFGMTTYSVWELQTLDQCRDMSAYIASYFPEPERVVLGISELLINAVEHGNLGISYDDKTHLNHSGQWEDEVNRRLTLPENQHKKVRVVYERKPDAIELSIDDEGPGFSWQEYMQITPKRARDNHGRGIAMSNIMSFDEMEYQGSGSKVKCTVRLS